MQTRVPPGSRLASQLEQAARLELPRIDNNAAREELTFLFQDESLFMASKDAWKLLLESLEDCGLEILTHQRCYQELNAQLQAVAGFGPHNLPNPKRNQILTLMHQETVRHEESVGFPTWLMKERFEPQALLQHAGVPVGLTESHEWQQEEVQYQELLAKIRAKEEDERRIEQQAAEQERQEKALLNKAREDMAMLNVKLNTKLNPSAQKNEPKSKQSETEKVSVEAQKPVVLKGPVVQTTRGSYLTGYRRGE